MDNSYRITVKRNLLAAIEMLKEVVALCPEEYWRKKPKFYYLAYHTAIFLDYYLAHPVKAFSASLPYTLTAQEDLPQNAIDDVIPTRDYSKKEIADYLSLVRKKCELFLSNDSSVRLKEKWIDQSEIEMHGLCPSLVVDYTILEILLYNLRHVQHHVGQMNLILRENFNKAASWISLAD